jgi:hypothetical protein
MRQEGEGTSKQWWQISPELGLAAGWAVICGALWVGAHLIGLI